MITNCTFGKIYIGNNINDGNDYIIKFLETTDEFQAEVFKKEMNNTLYIASQKFKHPLLI